MERPYARAASFTRSLRRLVPGRRGSSALTLVACKHSSSTPTHGDLAGFIVGDMQLPDPGEAPLVAQTGTLTFGINTQANNQMPNSVNIYPEGSGDLSATSYNSIPPITIAGKKGTDDSLFDSGTTDLVFDDSALAECQDQERYCPTSTTAVSTTTTDASSTTHEYSIEVANADTLFTEATASDCAYKEIASPAGDDGKEVILGLPFFYGRTIYVGIDGQTITGQTPPFEAF